MYVYLTASTDSTFDASGYAYKVSNSSIVTERRYGWTVVEAYLHGLLDVSNYIIKQKLYRNVSSFNVCTGSKLVIKILSTKYLDDLNKNSWKSLDGKPLFHVPLLKELYYHRLFYIYHKINWSVLTEVGETEYIQYESCQTQLNLILQEVP